MHYVYCIGLLLFCGLVLLSGWYLYGGTGGTSPGHWNSGSPHWNLVLCPSVGWLTSPSLVLVNCPAGTTRFNGSLVYIRLQTFSAVLFLFLYKPYGAPIPMGFPWESHSRVIFHSHAHVYPGPHKCVFYPQNASDCTYSHRCFPNFSRGNTLITEKREAPPQTLLLGARPPCHIFRASAPAIDVMGHRPNVHVLHSSAEQ